MPSNPLYKKLKEIVLIKNKKCINPMKISSRISHASVHSDLTEQELKDHYVEILGLIIQHQSETTDGVALLELPKGCKTIPNLKGEISGVIVNFSQLDYLLQQIIDEYIRNPTAEYQI